MGHEYQIFVKPVGALCNLACSYCYYSGNPDAEACGRLARHVMDDRVLEEFIRQNLRAAGDGPALFSWHGGEPTMAGISFYRRALALQEKHNARGIEVINGIQTNGTLLDDKWCSFLAASNFAVGLSIDGPEHYHDACRTYHNGRGSFRDAFRALRLMQKHGLQPEILCVVSAVNSISPKEVYSFFRDAGVRWLTFLPLVIRQGKKGSEVLPPSVNPQQWGEFLCTVFDEWVDNDIGRIQVQIIEETIQTVFRSEHVLCILRKECGGVPVVEKDGSFYLCDHYVDSEHKAGNIMNDSLTTLLDGSRLKVFGASKRTTLPAYCRRCEVLAFCNGECPRNRFVTSPDGEPGLNYLCEGYRRFFNHCRPFTDTVKAAAVNSGITT